MLPKNCIFCKIREGDIPANKLFEDDETLAFLNIRPVHPGHALVVPKEHHENLYEMPDELTGKLFITAKKTARAVKHAMNADGINVNMNNDPAAGQEVFHAHIHIIPRYTDDNLQTWEGARDYGDLEPEELAKKIATEFSL